MPIDHQYTQHLTAEIEGEVQGPVCVLGTHGIRPGRHHQVPSKTVRRPHVILHLPDPQRFEVSPFRRHPPQGFGKMATF